MKIKNSRVLKIFSVLAIILLVIQYVFGMIVNLFDNFDQVHITGTSFLEKTGLGFGYARTSGSMNLRLHWLNACLLLIVALVLLILGIKNRTTFIWLHAVLLFLILAIAAFSGAAFIAYNTNNMYSLSMAFAYLCALALATSLCIRIFLYSAK